MRQFTMVYLYSEHYEESFYHESEEALFVLHTDKRSGQSFRRALSLCCDPYK